MPMTMAYQPPFDPIFRLPIGPIYTGDRVPPRQLPSNSSSCRAHTDPASNPYQSFQAPSHFNTIDSLAIESDLTTDSSPNQIEPTHNSRLPDNILNLASDLNTQTDDDDDDCRSEIEAGASSFSETGSFPLTIREFRVCDGLKARLGLKTSDADYISGYRDKKLAEMWKEELNHFYQHALLKHEGQLPLNDLFDVAKKVSHGLYICVVHC